jgi:hypothetical protein
VSLDLGEVEALTEGVRDVWRGEAISEMKGGMGKEGKENEPLQSPYSSSTSCLPISWIRASSRALEPRQTLFVSPACEREPVSVEQGDEVGGKVDEPARRSAGVAPATAPSAPSKLGKSERASPTTTAGWGALCTVARRVETE